MALSLDSSGSDAIVRSLLGRGSGDADAQERRAAQEESQLIEIAKLGEPALFESALATYGRYLTPARADFLREVAKFTHKKAKEKAKAETPLPVSAASLASPRATPSQGPGALGLSEVVGRLRGARGELEQQGFSRREAESSLQGIDLARAVEMGTAARNPILLARGGERVGVLPDDRRRVQQLLDRGFVPVQGQLAGTAADVLGGPAQRAQALEATESSQRIADVSSLLERLDVLGPGAVGVRALLTENVAGAIGQVLPAAGDLTAQAVSGMSIEDLQSFRTRVRSVVAKSVAEVTGEESGRITEAERALAEQATSLVKPGRNFSQVRSGLVTLMQLSVIHQDKQLILSGAPPRSLASNEDIAAEAERLLDLGMNPATAAETITWMRRQREELSMVIDRGE